MSKHTEPQNLIRNLALLASLKSGDRIGAPKADGIFKKNGWRNDNDSIKHQANNILDLFKVALEVDSPTKATFDSCVSALNGLNKMLAGYQSNTSKKEQSEVLKRTIYEIDKLLTGCQAELDDSPSSGENVVLARNAIKYLKSLNIPSTNIRFNGHYHNEIDLFVGRYLRQEHRYNDPKIVAAYHNHLQSSNQEKYTALTKDQAMELLKRYYMVRSKILYIIQHEPSKSGTRKRLETLLNTEKQLDYSDESWKYYGYQFVSPKGSDEERIRLTRKAIKFGVGNCYEKSAIVATHMLEATRGSKSIFWVACIDYDHCFTIIADKNLLTVKDIEAKPPYDWTGDAVIVDGWTGDYYSATTIRNKAGLFKFHKNIARQGIVRNYLDIQKKDNSSQDADIFEFMGGVADGATKNAILVRESLSWPPRFDANFRLAVAKDRNASYRYINPRESIPASALERVSDNPSLLASSIPMLVQE